MVTNRPNHLKITISILHVFPQVQSLSLFPHKMIHPGSLKHKSKEHLSEEGSISLGFETSFIVTRSSQSSRSSRSWCYPEIELHLDLMFAKASVSTFKGSREVNDKGQKSFKIQGWQLFTPSGPWGSKLHNMSFFNWRGDELIRGTSWMECRLKWTEDSRGGGLRTSWKEIYLVVLMSSQQLLCLLITQLLAKGGQQVTEFSRADEPIAILHFVTQVKIWRKQSPCQNVLGPRWSHR